MHVRYRRPLTGAVLICPTPCHSSCADLTISGPKRPYSRINGKWGGEGACGPGYGGYLSAGESHAFSANVKGEYVKVEFHDGHQVVGEATEAPWSVDGIKLQPELRVLFAVGVKADGSRSASRPALVIMK